MGDIRAFLRATTLPQATLQNPAVDPYRFHCLDRLICSKKWLPTVCAANWDSLVITTQSRRKSRLNLVLNTLRQHPRHGMIIQTTRTHASSTTGAYERTTSFEYTAAVNHTAREVSNMADIPGWLRIFWPLLRRNAHWVGVRYYRKRGPVTRGVRSGPN